MFKKKEPTLKTLVLNDGTEVTLRPRISILALRRFQNDGLLPKSILQSFASADMHPEVMEPYMLDATWLAYINANPNKHMTKEEFESKLDLDFDQFGKIFAEMIAGSAADETKFATGFKTSTKK